jgi:hypothetical protein
MTEDDIREAANELLGEEGKDWRMASKGEYIRHVIFDHQIPIRKRVDFHLQATKCNPRARIQENIDWNPIFRQDF